MEDNTPTSREELKSYFKAGEYPTQGQFGKLIDSLKHKEDVLTGREAAMLANSLADIPNGYIQYFANNVSNQKFSLVIHQQDEEDQLIEIGDTGGNTVKKYFLGQAPYTIKANYFPAEGLKEHEYYLLQYQIDPNYFVYKLFGNNLPAIEKGHEFGTLKGKVFYWQVHKNNIGQKVNVVHTRIIFKNATDAAISYKAESGSWGDIYRTEDTVTDHYDTWDYLYFHYTADLRGTDTSIEYTIYDADREQRLQSGYLYAGQNNENVRGGEVSRLRNVRIEFNYSTQVPEYPQP